MAHIRKEVLDTLRTYFHNRRGDTHGIQGGMFPDITDTHDLGSATRRWGTIRAETVIADNITGGGVVDQFIELSDVPGDYIGDAAKFVVVLAGENGLEFVNLLAGDGLVKSLGAGTQTLDIELASPSGLSLASGVLSVADTIAGSGLAMSSKVLNVNLGDGLQFSGDNIEVNEAFNFVWTGTHSWNQDLQVDANLDFIGPQSITTSTGDLTLAPAGDLSINAGGGEVILAFTNALIRMSANNSVLSLRGGNAATAGGGIELYGGTHATEPNEIVFIRLTTEVGRFDENSDFILANDIVMTGGGQITTTASGSLTIDPAGDLLLNPTGDVSINPGGGDVILAFANALIRSSSNTSLVEIRGGNSGTAGAGIELYGGAHGTEPGEIVFYTGTTEVGRWNENRDLVLSDDLILAAPAEISTTGAGDLSLIIANGNLNITPSGDVLFNPTGNDVYPTNTFDLNLGLINKKWLTIHAAELWVDTLVAQDVIATIGGRIIVAPTSELVEDLPAPYFTDAVNGIDFLENGASADTIVRQDGGSWITDGFEIGDIIQVLNTPDPGTYTITGLSASTITLSIGSFTIDSNNDMDGIVYVVGDTITVKHNSFMSGDTLMMQKNGKIEFMSISAAPVANGNSWDYAVTRNLDGTGANAWFAGDALVNTGTTGSGFIELYSQDSINGRTFDYIFIDNGGVFSANLNESSNYDLFTSPSLNDAIYFGMNMSGTTIDWSNVFFNITTAMVSSGVTFAYEYWNGSWTALTGATPPAFTPAGQTALLFSGSSQTGWVDTTVNSASSRWVRIRISGFTSMSTIPHQGEKRIHAERSHFGPTIVGNVRQSTTFNDWKEGWAIGNLNGLYGYGSDLYGVGLGEYKAAVNHITIDATNGIRMFDGLSTVVGQWSGSTVVLGAVTAGSENIVLSADSILFRDNTTTIAQWQGDTIILGAQGAGSEYIILDPTNGIRFMETITALASWVGTTVTLGVTTGEYITLNPTDGIRFFDGATLLASWVGAVITLGPGAGAGNEYMTLSSSGLEIFSNNLKVVDIDNNGDFVFGQQNVTDKANLFWDQSTGIMQFRGGTSGTEIGVAIDASGGLLFPDVSSTDLDKNRISWKNPSNQLIAYLGPISTGNSTMYFKASGATATSDAEIQLWAEGGGSETVTQIRLTELDSDGGGTIRISVPGGMAVGKFFVEDESSAEYFTANSATGQKSAVINEASFDVDFRVESAANANAISLDSGVERLGFFRAPTDFDLEFDGTFGIFGSGVAHGVTTIAPTSTYAVLKIAEAASGGLGIEGLKDAGGVAYQAIYLRGILAEDANATHDATGHGIIRLIAAQSSGTALANVVANGNLVTIENNSATKWIVDAEGDTFLDGTQTAFDEYDDVALVRALSYEMFDPEKIVRSRWDEFINVNRETLVKAKLLAPGPNGFANYSGMTRLLLGTVWQQHTRFEELKEEVQELRGYVSVLEERLALLSAGS